MTVVFEFLLFLYFAFRLGCWFDCLFDCFVVWMLVAVYRWLRYLGRWLWVCFVGGVVLFVVFVLLTLMFCFCLLRVLLYVILL